MLTLHWRISEIPSNLIKGRDKMFWVIAYIHTAVSVLFGYMI